MRKDKRLKALQELKEDFKVISKMRVWVNIYNLIDWDYIPNDLDVYEVNSSTYSKSLVNCWTYETEENKYYSFYVEMVKKVKNKVVSEWVKIDYYDPSLLIKLYEILQDRS